MKGPMNTRRFQRGFSMAEVLAVVVILGIVAAIAAPNIVNMQREYRLAELNAKAEQVYNAAQYRATALQSGGKLNDLLKAVENEDLGPFVPSDYDYSQAAGDIYYTFKGQEAADKLLLTDEANGATKAMNDGQYAIEFAPKTGEIYSVFYWPDDASGYTAGSTQGFYLSHRDDRSDEAREGIPMGYYGGNIVGEAEPEVAGQMSRVQADIVNGEELYVKLTSSSFSRFASSQPDALDPAKLSLKIEVTDASESAGATPAKRVFEKSGNSLGLTEDATEIDVVLDSLVEKQSFDDLVNANNGNTDWEGLEIVTPGANVKVGVQVAYDDVDAFNSLDNATLVSSAFASHMPASGEDPATVDVKYLRHLRNLGAGFGGSALAPGTRVSIVSDIDFDGSTWRGLREGNAPVVSAALRKAAEGSSWNPLSALAPIELASGGGQFNVGGTGGIIQAAQKEDGTYCALQNFVVKGAGAQGTGLFASSAVTVKHVTLDGVSVEGGSNVGALVGTLTDGGAVESCLLAGNVSVSATGSNVGALIGAAEGGAQVDGSGVGIIDEAHESPARPAVSTSLAEGAANAGGFVGSVSGGVVIQGSYTTATVSAGSAAKVGGFAGALDRADESDGSGGCSITDSYASGAVTGGSSVGGFVGEAAGQSTVSACFATSDVSGSSSVGGFAGWFDSSATWSNCRAYGEVSGEGAAGFAGSVAEEREIGSECSYLRMANYNGFGDDHAATYGQLALPDPAENAPYTHAFDATLKGSSVPFPFPRVGDLDYYGDWPLAVKVIWAYAEGSTCAETWGLAGTVVPAHEPVTRVEANGDMLLRTVYSWQSQQVDISYTELTQYAAIETSEWKNPLVSASSKDWYSSLLEANLASGNAESGQVVVDEQVILSSRGASPASATSARDAFAGWMPQGVAWTVSISAGTFDQTGLSAAYKCLIGDGAMPDSGVSGVWLVDGSGSAAQHGTASVASVGDGGRCFDISSFRAVS